jgi:hypothetical protein
MKCCECECGRQEEALYGLDAAGQKVYAGDYIMAALPNVPAVHRPLALHPCRVLQVNNAGFEVEYAGSNVRFRKWAREPFFRWRPEVVKADLSALGLENASHGSGDAEDGSCPCCPGRYYFECNQG